jgi:phytoene dehydrogenase-like protein
MSIEFMKYDYDAIVVGSGPNGLAAAIRLQQEGLSVLILEAKATIGGGMRTAELTLPGFKHDVCSAVHPMAVASPFFKTLPLQQQGLEFIYPEFSTAHPFDDGTAAVLAKSIAETASLLKEDEEAYLNLFRPIVNNWSKIDEDLLAPLHFPKHPLLLAQFGLKALQPALSLAKQFKTKEAKGLWAGMTSHAVLPLSSLSTSAIGLVLTAVGHTQGWPIPKGGSQSLADALAAHFLALGGKIQINTPVASLDQLPSAKAVLFDVSPHQLLDIAGYKFSGLYKWQLERYRFGMGVFKVDWALDASVPFTAEECQRASTVHIGNTLEEIALAEQQTANGKHVDKPFVMFSQPSLFDDTRAPQGKHTAWAYCHVPNGSGEDRTEAIEKQIERFAPGFRERIIGRHVMNTQDMQTYNPNYIGGDVNGGSIDITQLFTRPALRASPYRTSKKGLYICSASTPPGGGVHGMSGFHAAEQALKDIFKKK